LPHIGNAFNCVVATDAINTRTGFVRKGRIGIDFAFMFPVVKHYRATPAGNVQFDRDALRLALSSLRAGKTPGNGF